MSITSLQISLNAVKELVDDAMRIDLNSDGSTETRLAIYQKYIRSMRKLFTILDDDFQACQTENKQDILKNIRQNHFSILTTAENCVRRLILQFWEENDTKNLPLSPPALESRTTSTGHHKLHSLPIIPSIDMLLAEQPVNPADTAKFKLQKLVNATNALLKSDRLTVSDRASIQLRISRKIEENLSIAKKHEEQLIKKHTDSLGQLLESVDRDINKHKFLRAHEEFPIVYKNSQLFYYHILKNSRTYSLIQSHHSPETSCLSFILRINNTHPVVVFLERIIEKMLQIEITKENETIFLKEIQTFKDTVENLSKLCCLIINIELKDHIMNVYPKLLTLLFQFIFKNPKIGPFIYKFLFRIYDDQINQYCTNVKFVKDNHDFQILLNDKFKTQIDFINVLDKQVDEFSTLRQYLNPMEKIDKLCQIITDLMSKIQNLDSKLEIGADELVPIIVYMIMKFSSAEIFLHGKYLEHLLPDSYLVGMEGYLLVSIICAITFCVSENFIQHISKN